MVACLVTLVALLVMEENWRGKRDWNAYVREHEARGDRLDIAALIPPPVPDDQNFATTTLLAPLFHDETGTYSHDLNEKLKFPEETSTNGRKAPPFGDRQQGKEFNLDEWQTFLGGDPLVWLQKLDPELTEISEAVRRPYSRFPLAYDKGFMMRLPHLGPLRQLAQLYALRASAELRTGKNDAALADVQTIFRLEESLKDDPLLISLLVRMVILQQGLQVIWEGLEDHQWTDAQLRVLQDETARVDFLKGLSFALHGERAGLNGMILSVIANPRMFAQIINLSGDGKHEGMDSLLGFIPSGFHYQNMLEMNRYYEKYTFATVDLPARRVYPELMKREMQTLVDYRRSWSLSRIWIGIMMPVFGNLEMRVAYLQTSADQAVIACALERFRLANGQYPDVLAKLVPAYIKEIPLDVVNGEATHYRLNSDGTFLLYSDGWDGTDHGGKQIMKPGKAGVDLEKSDWVWFTRN